MRFELEVEIDAKRNVGKALDKAIQNASDGILRDKRVKTVDVRGRWLNTDDDEEVPL